MAKKTTLELIDEYYGIAQSLDGDVEGRRAADAYLTEQGFAGGDGTYSWAATPALLTDAALENFEQAAATMGSIMEKVMRQYHRDRAFRSLFGLTREVEELTLVPSGCHAAVPLSRIDLFVDPETLDYKVTGIQTGALEGMYENVEVTRTVQQTAICREFSARHKVETLDVVDGLVLALLHTYGKWTNAQEGRNHPTKPSIAVVDVAGSRRLAESEYVIKRMQDYGCYAHATEVGELRIDKVGGLDQLVDNHGPVTCVWMRPTAEEAVANMDRGVRSLMKATRSGLVCTIGGYRSWPCCAKSFFEVLRTRECRMLLSPAENAFIEKHLIETHAITPAIDLSSFYDQNNWVLRTEDGRNEGSTIAGSDMSRSAWRTRLVKGIKRQDVVQAYVSQRTAATILGPVDEDDPCAAVQTNVMFGLYVFEGRLGGIRAICGTGNTTTASWTNRTAMGSLLVYE